jgi:hypothetical protein
MIEEIMEFKEGFSSVVIIAILYSAFVMIPMVIFANLYGVGMGGAIPYIMIILITQMSTLLGRKPFTKQEIFTAYIATAVTASYTGMGTYAIFNTYMRSAPGIRIASRIPTWAAIPLSSDAYIMRTLIHTDWIPFILVNMGTTVLWYIANMVLGLMAAQLYLEIEKLPFPFAKVGAEAVLTLSERSPERLKYFTLFFIPGAAFATVIYALPVVSAAITRRTGITLVPIPWADLSFLLDPILPGGAFGITTDPLAFAAGFIIPFDICVYMFIGAISVYTIGNSVLYKAGLLPRVYRMMSIPMNFTFSYLDFWASPIVGLTIAAALMPIIMHPQSLVGLFKSLGKLSKYGKEAGYIPLKLLLTLYIVSTMGTVAVTLYLCPGFLPYTHIAIIMGVLWPFIFVMAQARGIAVSGYALNIPFVWEGVLGAIPYSDVDIWFAPLYTSRMVGIGSPTGEWAGTVAMAKLTGTKLTSIYKAWFLALPITWAMTWIFTSAFWNLAPIPSTFYPMTAQTWPMSAAITDLFMSKTFTTALNPLWVMGAFLVGAVAYVASSFLGASNFLMGIVLGASGYVSGPFPTLVGAILDRFLITKVLGKTWKEYKATAVAGLTCGEGIVLGLAALIAVLFNSLIIIPY